MDTGRRTIYTHPHSGAETQVLTILRRERNKPLTRAKALPQVPAAAGTNEPCGDVCIPDCFCCSRSVAASA